MAIHYKAALLYPYRGNHIENAILFPGLLTYVYIIILSIVMLLLLLFLWMMGGQDLDSLKQTSDNLFNLVNFPFNLVLTAFFHGFQWHLYSRFQTQGFEADPPSWLENWKSFLIDGLKIAVFYMMISIPLLILLAAVVLGAIFLFGFSSMDYQTKVLLGVVLGVIAFLGWIALLPFWAAPLIHSAQSRKFSELCNLKKAIEITLPRYWDVMVTFLLILLTGFLYMLGSLLLTITCIGILGLPFLLVGMNITTYHLLAQGFGYGEDKEHLSTAPSIISPG